MAAFMCFDVLSRGEGELQTRCQEFEKILDDNEVQYEHGGSGIYRVDLLRITSKIVEMLSSVNIDELSKKTAYLYFCCNQELPGAKWFDFTDSCEICGVTVNEGCKCYDDMPPLAA